MVGFLGKLSFELFRECIIMKNKEMLCITKQEENWQFADSPPLSLGSLFIFRLCPKGRGAKE